MYVCVCRAIREDTVRQLGRSGVIEPHDLTDALGLHMPECCGRCVRKIERFVEIALSEVTGLPERASLAEESKAMGVAIAASD